MKRKILLLIVTIISLGINATIVFMYRNVGFDLGSFINFSFSVNILFIICLAIYSHYRRKPAYISMLLLLPYLVNFIIYLIIWYINLDINVLINIGPLIQLVTSLILIFSFIINYKYKNTPVFLNLIVFEIIYIICIFMRVPYLLNQIIIMLKLFITLFMISYEIITRKDYLESRDDNIL